VNGGFRSVLVQGDVADLDVAQDIARTDTIVSTLQIDGTLGEGTSDATCAAVARRRPDGA